MKNPKPTLVTRYTVTSALKAYAIALSLIAGMPINAAEESPKPKPNIVFIFIDDMGYGDIGPFGSKGNKTPHLDQMAKEGLKMTDFYVSSTKCTPSRAALLTGCYADRIGMGGDVVFPADPRGLNPSEITIAEMLKEEGYATGCFGKWHLGDMSQFMPLKQGFDEYEGIPYSNDMWTFGKNRNTKKPYSPLPYLKQDHVVAQVTDAASQALLCEAVSEAALDFIRRHKDEPFFAYIPYSFVHLPRMVTQERATRAEGDVTRAQVEELDDNVGRILGLIKELEISENTLVFFTSDNGPASGLSAGPLRGKKAGPKYEGHMRVPTLAWWPGKIPAGTVCTEIGCSTDILPTLAALTGASVPSDRIIDGTDISKLLLEPGAPSPHSELYYGFEGIRQGNWKLVIPKPGAKPELFDLQADLGEKKNLAQQHPEKAEALSGLLKAHESRILDEVRPAGVAENPVPLIMEIGNLPTLAEYMGKSGIKTAGKVNK